MYFQSRHRLPPKSPLRAPYGSEMPYIGVNGPHRSEGTHRGKTQVYLLATSVLLLDCKTEVKFILIIYSRPTWLYTHRYWYWIILCAWYDILLFVSYINTIHIFNTYTFIEMDILGGVFGELTQACAGSVYFSKSLQKWLLYRQYWLQCKLVSHEISTHSVGPTHMCITNTFSAH